MKVISSANMLGFSEAAKAAHITKTVEDAYRVSVSLLPGCLRLVLIVLISDAASKAFGVMEHRI